VLAGWLLRLPNRDCPVGALDWFMLPKRDWPVVALLLVVLALPNSDAPEGLLPNMLLIVAVASMSRWCVGVRSSHSVQQ